MDHGVLNVAREAGRQAVEIDLGRVAAFRFEEQLVAFLVGKPHDFRFDRGTVARPIRSDLPRVHGGSVEILPDDVVDLLVGVGDPAGNLLAIDPLGEEGERFGLLVAGLDFGLRIVDRAAVEPGGGSGLETFDLESQSLKGEADSGGGLFTGPAAGDLLLAVMEQASHEGAGGEDDGAGPVFGIAADAHADDSRCPVVAFRQQVDDRLLPKREVLLEFERHA